MSGSRTSDDGRGDRFAPTPRTTLQHAEHATYERAAIYSILDAQLTGYVATVKDGEPVLRPMSHIRIDSDLFLHGHCSNRLLTHLKCRAPLCFGVAVVDGVVLGRRIDTHTINFRSVTVHGRAEEVTERDAKLNVLRHAFERLAPDRWERLPPLATAYIDEMTILRIRLIECVAKIRSGLPSDFASPADPDLWAGVVPISATAGAPQGDA
jgi:nitroimidazol reductase NimA-like FMN-containing flavoprotein (pyridoxamine 5'-phosphate oxidase superfamily)